MERSPLALAQRTRGMRAGKMRFAAIQPDAEAGPVMKLLDDLLATVNASVSLPCAAVERMARRGCNAARPPACVSCPRAAANDGDEEKSRLPSPKNFLLTKHEQGKSLEIPSRRSYQVHSKRPKTASARSRRRLGSSIMF